MVHLKRNDFQASGGQQALQINSKTTRMPNIGHMLFAAFPDRVRKSGHKFKSSRLGLRGFELSINFYLGLPVRLWTSHIHPLEDGERCPIYCVHVWWHLRTSLLSYAQCLWAQWGSRFSWSHADDRDIWWQSSAKGHLVAFRSSAVEHKRIFFFFFFFNNERRKSWDWKGDYSFVLRPLLLITPHLREQRQPVGFTVWLAWCHSTLAQPAPSLHLGPTQLVQRGASTQKRSATSLHSSGHNRNLTCAQQAVRKQVQPKRDVISGNKRKWHSLGMKRHVQSAWGEKMGYNVKSSISCQF